MRYSTKIPQNFLLKRMKFILIPYAIFGLFITFRLFLGDSSDKSFWEIFLNIVVEGKFFGWFVLVIFQFYILHRLFYKLLSKANPIFVLVVTFIISFGHSYLMYYSTAYLEFWIFILYSVEPLFYIGYFTLLLVSTSVNIMILLFIFKASFSLASIDLAIGFILYGI